MKNKSVLIYSILIFCILIGFILYSYNADRVYFVSPDETALSFFSNLYAHEGKLSYYEPLGNISSTIRPRNAFFINGNIVLGKFVGFPLLFGHLNLFNNLIIGFITPLFASLCIFYIFKITILFSNRKEIALISSLLLLFNPFFWYWANHPFYENVITVSFIFIGVYYFLLSIKVSNYKIFYISILFFAISLVMRYDSLLFILLFVLIYLNNLKFLDIKKILVSILILFLIVSPSLIINEQLFGSYFQYANSYGVLKSEQEGSSKINSFLGNSFNILLRFNESKHNLLINTLFIISFIPLFYLLVLLSLLRIINTKDRMYKKFLIFIIIFIIAFSSLYLTQTGYKDKNVFNDSFNRYLLIFYVVSPIILSGFLIKNLNKKIALITILILLIITIPLVLSYFYDKWAYSNRLEKINSFVLLNTKNNSIILTNSYDKVIFPSRKIITQSNFNQDFGEFNYSHLAHLTKELEKINITIYLYGVSINETELKKGVESKNMSLIKLNFSENFYKLTYEK